jgi:hypothetical protein
MDVYARRRLVAVLAIVLVVVLIGVAVAGGGDDEEAPITTVAGTSAPGAAASLGKDDFVEQADDICDETGAAIANLSTDDAEELAEEELGLTESELESLRSLPPPEEDQALLDDFFSAHEDQIAFLEKRLLAIQRNDEDAATEAETQISTATSDLRRAARRYGFDECGTQGEPTTDTDAVAPTDTGTAPAVPAPEPPVTTPPATTPPPAEAPPPPPPPADDGGDRSGGTGSDSGGVGP